MGWLSNVVHGVLDVAGMIPGVGAVADGLNAVIYVAEGDYVNAAMSAVAMIPGIGDSIALANKGAKVIKGMKGLSKLEKSKFLVKGLKKNGTKALDALKGVMKDGASFLKKCNPKKAFKNIKKNGKHKCLFGKCFVGDTMVYTIEGYRPICEIQKGDLVYSMNEETGETGFQKVESIFFTWVHTIYEIQLEGDYTIQTTAYHPFYVAEQGWVNAICLEEENLLLSSEGILEIKAIHKGRYEEPVKTYNFHVEEWVSYFVSKGNVYVHNGRGGHPKPKQIHHFATNKSKKYTAQFENVLNKYKLKLNEAWNKASLPHQGRHPYAYHDYVLSNIKKFDKIAKGNTEKFVKMYDKMKQKIINNPDMLYKDFWKKK